MGSLWPLVKRKIIVCASDLARYTGRYLPIDPDVATHPTVFFLSLANQNTMDKPLYTSCTWFTRTLATDDDVIQRCRIQGKLADELVTDLRTSLTEAEARLDEATKTIETQTQKVGACEVKFEDKVTELAKRSEELRTCEVKFADKVTELSARDQELKEKTVEISNAEARQKNLEAVNKDAIAKLERTRAQLTTASRQQYAYKRDLADFTLFNPRRGRIPDERTVRQRYFDRHGRVSKRVIDYNMTPSDCVKVGLEKGFESVVHRKHPNPRVRGACIVNETYHKSGSVALGKYKRGEGNLLEPHNHTTFFL